MLQITSYMNCVLVKINFKSKLSVFSTPSLIFFFLSE